MGGLPDDIDPVINAMCMIDNASAARAYMTPPRRIQFFKTSIAKGSQIIFEMCFSRIEEVNDHADMVLIVNESLPLIIKHAQTNILYFLMEKYGDAIKARAQTRDPLVFLVPRMREYIGEFIAIGSADRYVRSIRMLDALIWCECVGYTGTLKWIVVNMPVHTEGLEWLMRTGPIEFLQECHDAITGPSEMKRMLSYHLPRRLFAMGLHMHDIEGLDKSIIDRILRLAANSRY